MDTYLPITIGQYATIKLEDILTFNEGIEVHPQRQLIRQYRDRNTELLVEEYQLGDYKIIAYFDAEGRPKVEGVLEKTGKVVGKREWFYDLVGMKKTGYYGIIVGETPEDDIYFTSKNPQGRYFTPEEASYELFGTPIREPRLSQVKQRILNRISRIVRNYFSQLDIEKINPSSLGIRDSFLLPLYRKLGLAVSDYWK